DGIHVMYSLSQSGKVLSRFVYGNKVDERLARVKPSTLSSVEFYHTDAQGSTTELSDEVGNRTSRYRYTAFGEMRIKQAGESDNQFLYAGRQWDNESELYYNRFRMYAPGLGRFTGKDAMPGNSGSPISFHQYMYGNNNPTMYVDPMGLSSVVSNHNTQHSGYGSYDPSNGITVPFPGFTPPGGEVPFPSPGGGGGNVKPVTPKPGTNPGTGGGNNPGNTPQQPSKPPTSGEQIRTLAEVVGSGSTSMPQNAVEGLKRTEKMKQRLVSVQRNKQAVMRAWHVEKLGLIKKTEKLLKDAKKKAQDEGRGSNAPISFQESIKKITGNTFAFIEDKDHTIWSRLGEGLKFGWDLGVGAYNRLNDMANGVVNNFDKIVHRGLTKPGKLVKEMVEGSADLYHESVNGLWRGILTSDGNLVGTSIVGLGTTVGAFAFPAAKVMSGLAKGTSALSGMGSIAKNGLKSVAKKIGRAGRRLFSRKKGYLGPKKGWPNRKFSFDKEVRFGNKPVYRNNFWGKDKQMNIQSQVKDGLLRDRSGNAINGDYIYNIDNSGNIFFEKDIFRGRHHSSLIGGENSFGAGHLNVNNGIISKITDATGHYSGSSGFHLNKFQNYMKHLLDKSGLKNTGQINYQSYLRGP
ncbi:MAG: RHS repeat-associated core domain-containing protein, partial [Candidatus Peribacteraceae bacterium]|nr:RHS repeat-associated core domain-containing protein [Candidatus Peribacteraceae bacterium]